MLQQYTQTIRDTRKSNINDKKNRYIPLEYIGIQPTSFN